MEHVLGKYIISDRPMTEEEWIRERGALCVMKVDTREPSGPYGLNSSARAAKDTASHRRSRVHTSGMGHKQQTQWPHLARPLELLSKPSQPPPRGRR
jgi:hypothetical protein